MHSKGDPGWYLTGHYFTSTAADGLSTFNLIGRLTSPSTLSKDRNHFAILVFGSTEEEDCEWFWAGWDPSS